MLIITVRAACVFSLAEPPAILSQETLVICHFDDMFQLLSSSVEAIKCDKNYEYPVLSPPLAPAFLSWWASVINDMFALVNAYISSRFSLSLFRFVYTELGFVRGRRSLTSSTFPGYVQSLPPSWNNPPWIMQFRKLRVTNYSVSV